MSEQLAQLKKKSMSEAVLWTNPNPTTDFSAQNVTLSKALSNFDYIGVKFRCTKSHSSYATIFFKVDDFKTFLNSNTAYTFGAALSASVFDTQGYSYARRFYYIDNTHIAFANCTIINYSPSTLNSFNIPIEIIGLR